VSESKHELIAAALQDALSSIPGDGGDNYWYTYRVGRTVTFGSEDLDTSIGMPLIVLSPGEETMAEGESGDPTAGFSVNAAAEFFAMLCVYVGSLEEDAWKQDGADSRWLIANRMVKDFLKKLFSDVQLGSLVENVAKDEIVIDRRRFTVGLDWVLVEVRFVVQYTLLSGDP